ncbi:hypothetical protein FA15DRAFT_166052 [Coprinopsis marcescibilis]|uniref:Uncharacterized protein n=1 Tax=Coprinopsis marcescibilis TaxID=230819 RepID=A0A5C3KHX2_COPMA|nr:hypothetical protein FA15DRAFT_166052 [Coprinopsis marcescibilis]
MTTRIDDSDSRVARESGFWMSLTTNTIPNYQGTMLVTTQSNSRVGLRFTGTSIAVFGYIPAQGSSDSAASEVVSRYYIDGNLLHTYTGQIGPQHQTHVLFFQSGQLSQGEHVLAVQSSTDGPVFGLDYFDVGAPQQAAPAPAPGPTPQASDRPTSTSAVTSLRGDDDDASDDDDDGGDDDDDNRTREAPSSTPASPQGPDGQPLRTSLSPASTATSTVGPSAGVPSTSARTASPELGGINTLLVFTEDAANRLPTGRPGSGSGTASVPLGAVVGAAVGGVAVLLLAILLFVVCVRRRRARNTLYSSSDHPRTGIYGHGDGTVPLGSTDSLEDQEHHKRGYRTDVEASGGKNGRRAWMNDIPGTYYRGEPRVVHHAGSKETFRNRQMQMNVVPREDQSEASVSSSRQRNSPPEMGQLPSSIIEYLDAPPAYQSP